MCRSWFCRRARNPLSVRAWLAVVLMLGQVGLPFLSWNNVNNAEAHTTPDPGSASGVTFSLQVTRANGAAIGGGETVTTCETLTITTSVAFAGTPNAALEAGTMRIITPDAVTHNQTP